MSAKRSPIYLPPTHDLIEDDDSVGGICMWLQAAAALAGSCDISYKVFWHVPEMEMDIYTVIAMNMFISCVYPSSGKVPELPFSS